MSGRQRLTLLMAPLVLTACAAAPSAPTAPENARFLERRADLSALESWRVTGRIAFRIADEGGTGAMTWAQSGRAMTFSFRGPIGAGAFQIEGSPPDLVLETGDGEVHHLSDPEAELNRHFGLSAPFGSLRYWMVGVPDPLHSAVTAVDEEGLLRRLEQGGWDVTYDRYHNGAPRLPRKLTLLRDDVRIRVIVDYWRLPGRSG